MTGLGRITVKPLAEPHQLPGPVATFCWELRRWHIRAWRCYLRFLFTMFHVTGHYVLPASSFSWNKANIKLYHRASNSKMCHGLWWEKLSENILERGQNLPAGGVMAKIQFLTVIQFLVFKFSRHIFQSSIKISAYIYLGKVIVLYVQTFKTSFWNEPIFTCILLGTTNLGPT